MFLSGWVQWRYTAVRHFWHAAVSLSLPPSCYDQYEKRVPFPPSLFGIHNQAWQRGNIPTTLKNTNESYSCKKGFFSSPPPSSLPYIKQKWKEKERRVKKCGIGEGWQFEKWCLSLLLPLFFYKACYEWLEGKSWKRGGMLFREEFLWGGGGGGSLQTEKKEGGLLCLKGG